jgi:hypothetical protein
MTEPTDTTTAETHGERVHREQAQREAAREQRRQALSYNANAPTDHANGDPA